MTAEQVIRLTALIILGVVEAVNLMTARIDSFILGMITALVGALAGYGYGFYRTNQRRR